MNLPRMKISLWRPATLLLAWIASLACGLLPGYSTSTRPTVGPLQPIGIATLITEQAVKPTNAPASPAESTIAPVVTARPYSLAIRDRYKYFEAKVVLGASLAARPGEVWIGTLSGTLEKVDAQTGTFLQSIALVPQQAAGVKPTIFPVQKMAFEGKYLWAFAGSYEDDIFPPSLFSLDPGTGEVVHQWDLNSPEWMQNYERGYTTEGFGVSPGRVWIDGHVVDTTTFEMQTVSMPGDARFAYDGKEWMWMNGELGGACDDLILVNVNDPAKEWCEDDWPFFTHDASGIHPTGMGSPMAFTGDRVWMAGAWPAKKVGDPLSNVLEAYPADIDQAMESKGPLVSIPFVDGPESIQLFFAGDALWVLDASGGKMGYLFQLDPQTGETLNSLDLLGEAGRAVGDMPMDIAAEDDNLWILTTRQLLRIKLP